MIKSLLTGITFIIASFSFAQQIKPNILGSLSSNNVKIANGSIMLLNAKDSSLNKIAITDSYGKFYFNNIKDGSYLLFISCLGYQNKYIGPYNLNASLNNINVGNVQLLSNSRELKEIRIVATKPYIERKLNKTVFNIENSVFGLGSTGFEIFETLPGVNIRNNEELSISGKTNIAVYIDDKPSNLSGANLIEYLKNLQTNNIEKIEIINGNSARFDAAFNGGIINIKFKKGKNIGTNGTASGGGGLGINYRYNGGININNRTKKTNLFVNYDYTKIKALDQTFLLRNVEPPMFVRSKNDVLFDIKNDDTKTRDNNNLIVGFDYWLNKNQSLSILVNSFSNKMFSDETNRSFIFNNGIKDSTVATTSLENRLIQNVSGNINYKRILNQKGDNLSFDVDFLTFSRKSVENLESNYLNNSQNQYKTPLSFTNQTPSKINISSAKFDYSKILENKAGIDFGIKLSEVNTQSNRLIEIKSGKNYINNPSTNFKYKENILAAYLNYSQTKEKGTLNLGLRVEQTFAKGDTTSTNLLINRNYLGLFPNLSYSRNINKFNKLSFSFNRGINRPIYEQLNPFFNFLDQFTFNAGNPQLNPFYIYANKIEWELKEKYVTSLKYNYSDGFIYTIYEQNQNSNIAIASTRNFDYRQTIGLSLSVPIKIAKWYDVDLYGEGNLEYFKYKNEANQTIYNNSKNASFVLNHNITAPKGIRMMINMVYESPTAYAIYQFKPLYFMNIGVSKAILQKQGSLRLSITDLFNTNSNRYGTQVLNLNLSAKDKSETQSLRLSFSYKFGKKEVKAYQKRKLGADEEKGRVGL